MMQTSRHGHSTFAVIQVIAAAAMISLVLPQLPAWAADDEEATQETAAAELSLSFVESEFGAFSDDERARVAEILRDTHSSVQERLPDLPDQVSITVELVDWDLAMVGGVTGRADAPGEIIVQVSGTYEGGVAAAIEAGLAETLAHEMHHLVRGWTISGNRFGPGISIAAVNEGLAIVFAEELTGVALAGNAPPAEEVAQEWAQEILALPRFANYQHWMFQHPDGRVSIGYRTGHFVVRRAMSNSGLDIVALSAMAPEDIWALAGF